jgi:hypothetical protein
MGGAVLYGLITALIVILVWVAVSSAKRVLIGSLQGYWAGGDGFVLFAPRNSPHLTVQEAPGAPPVTTKSALAPTWSAPFAVAGGGALSAGFVVTGDPVPVGDGAAVGGTLELDAGRLILRDAGGAELARLFRDPAGAAAANAALVDDNADDI